MEPNRRFTLMAFPQGFDGTTLKVNIVFIPKNMDPFGLITTGLVAPDHTAKAFADVQPTFEAGIVRGLDEFPFGNATAPARVPIKKPLTIKPATNKKAVLTAIATDFNGRITLTATDKAEEAITTGNVKNSVKKYLPHSYREAFNFTSPRHPNATTDDSYHCIMRNDVKPVVKPVKMNVSWGELYAHILRQPLLAKACGIIYNTELKVEPGWFENGGYLYIDVTLPEYVTIQNKSLESPNGAFIKRYAARIPKLKTGEARTVFAPILFPVLHRKTSDVVDPEPQNAPWDQVFAEVSEYDDGFAKIVHANQPVSGNLLEERQDGFHPQKDAGIRMGWDDEQILIWYIRQLTENPNQPNSKVRVDAPLGVFGYRIDVKHNLATADWESLNMVEATKEYVLQGQSIGNSKQQLELPYQVYPVQPDGNTTGAYWLPMYYGNWIGKSMVMKDKEGAEIYLNDKALIRKTKIVNGKREVVSEKEQKASTDQLFKEVATKAKLVYGNTYYFRVRLMDISGGGPTVKDPDPDDSTSSFATVEFRRYVAPGPLIIAKSAELQKNIIEYFNQRKPPAKGFDDAPNITVSRPLLNYPAVVFTNKYQLAGLDPIALLKEASVKLASTSAFGIPDPDVTKIEIRVEVETLRMDNLKSISGAENYATLYVTHRKFSNKFDEVKNLPVRFVDVPELNFESKTNPFKNDSLNKAALDAMENIMLPTARRIRITLRAFCDGDGTYFGHINDDPNLDSRYGSTTQLEFYCPSKIEDKLLGEKENVPGVQALYLQPDKPFVNDGKLSTLFIERQISEVQPDIVQRLASQLGVEAKGLTLVARKGYRVVFGCSNRIRHTLAPDHSSITFASKADLTNHWLGCLTYKLGRDWTWNALEDISFKISRWKKFKRDANSEAEDLNFKTGDKESNYAGDIEIKHTVSFEALQQDTFGFINRDHTTIIFIDAIEPKSSLKQTGGDLRFPDELMVQYGLLPQFKSDHASTADKAKIETELLVLPTTVNPSQIPKLVSTGIAFSPYRKNDNYSATEPRKKYLWLEFEEPVKDPNDTIFCRVLANAPDQLISNNNPELWIAPAEPPLPIDPEYIRKITPDQSDDMAGLSAMQAMEKAKDSDVHYLLPIPPGMHAESPELFGFFTYEFRIGHAHRSDVSNNVWSTAQGRFGRSLRVTGMQHPAPNLLCSVNRNEKILYVNAPYAQAVFNGKNVTAEPPRTQLWGLLYAQVKQADGKAIRNILLTEKKMDWRRKLFTTPQQEENTKKFIVEFKQQAKQFQRPAGPVGNVTQSSLIYTKQALAIGAEKAIFKDQQRYGLAIWENKEVEALLDMFGLPIDSPLSVLVVEVFGNITSFRDQITNINNPDVRRNLSTSLQSQKIDVTSDTRFNQEVERATQTQEKAMIQDTSISSPLSSGLGHYRILRTSPLTEVPFVCCTD